MIKIFYTASLITAFLCTHSTAQAGLDDLEATFKIVSVEVSADKQIRFTTEAENNRQHFVIEQFVFNRWMQVEEVVGKGKIDTVSYSLSIQKHLHSGLNKFRIRYYGPNNVGYFSQVVRYESDLKKTSAFKKGKQVLLTQRVPYFVYDDFGILIAEGHGSVIDLKALPSQKNIFICFDNQFLEL